MNTQFFRDHFTIITVSDKGTEVKGLFDAGETRAAIAAQMGVTQSTVEHLTQAPAPVYPALPAHLIERLPAHLQALARRNSL